MRPINVSTELYAAIWSRHQPGDADEDAILRRELKVTPAPKPTSTIPIKIGFSDPRFGIELEQGFEISRVYKGVEYKARAEGGKWRLLNTGATYASLNQLSQAVSGNVENAWRNWYFTNSRGHRELVTALRK